MPGPTRGVLPDGTPFDVVFESPVDEKVQAVSAGILIDAGQGYHPLGEVTFLQGAAQEEGWVGEDLYRVAAGSWIVEIELSGAARSALGEESRSTLEESVEVSTHLDLPVLTLSPPLRWAGSEETVMEIRYETFAVRSGCGERAVQCNPTRAISVVPLEEAAASGWAGDQIWLQSYALRPESDPYYLDPGPLSARWAPDVMWSGEEMIVWGGASFSAAPHLVDGAGFDPESDSWRMLSPGPLRAEQATRAVWAGDEMVVISEEATVAYDPIADDWRIVAPGITPPMDPGLVVWTGSAVVAWTSDGIHRLERGSGQWARVPEPGEGEPGLQGNVLRVLDGRLYAVGGDCEQRLVWQWSGEEWTEVAQLSLTLPTPGHCAYPGQTAAVDGRLVLWGGDASFSYDPETDEWEQTAELPLAVMERPPGPVILGDRFLVMGLSEAAIFDPSSGRWTRAEPPGQGTDVDMVWTGEEVLMWGKCCYGPEDVDAWRWRPPISTSG